MSRIKLGACTVLALLITGCSPVQEAAIASPELMPPQKAGYDTCTVERKEYTKTSTVRASLLYPVTAALSAPKDGLRIGELLVTGRQDIKKGDVLLRFHTEESEAEVRELEKKLEDQGRAFELEKKKREDAILEAERDIRDHNYYLYELDRRTLNADLLRSELSQYICQTEYELRKLRKEIGRKREEFSTPELIAPFDGRIEEVTSRKNGDPAPKGEVLLKVSSSEQFLIAANNASGLSAFRYRMPVTVTAGAKGERESYSGIVVTVNDLLPPKAGFPSLAAVQLDEATDVEKLQVNAEISGNTVELSGALTADRAAVTQNGGKYYVNILEGEMLQKRVVVSNLLESDTFVALYGLEEGQTLVCN